MRVLNSLVVAAMITSRERARRFCGKLFYFVGHFCKRFSVHLHIDPPFSCTTAICHCGTFHPPATLRIYNHILLGFHLLVTT